MTEFCITIPPNFGATEMRRLADLLNHAAESEYGNPDKGSNGCSPVYCALRRLAGEVEREAKYRLSCGRKG